MAFFHLWIFLRKTCDLKSFFFFSFLQFITHLLPPWYPWWLCTIHPVSLTLITKNKRDKGSGRLVKKRQVLGEIGRHHSIIGLGKGLLNPCLDGRTECEIWEAFCSRWFSCSLASLHFPLFWRKKTEKWKLAKLGFRLASYGTITLVHSCFTCTTFHNYQLTYLNMQMSITT